jgi:hypothetical protein
VFNFPVLYKLPSEVPHFASDTEVSRRDLGVMGFWKTLIPDEPLILDGGSEEARYLNRMPPAVKGWCLVSLVANGLIVAIATAIFQNGGPFLVGAIFALFPSYMLLFWKDLVSTANIAKQKAFERTPFAFQLNLSVQWVAISLCVAAPVMLSSVCVILWFTYMKQ